MVALVPQCSPEATALRFLHEGLIPQTRVKKTVFAFPGWGGEPKFGGGENPPSAQCHFISIGKPIKKKPPCAHGKVSPPLNLRPPPNQTIQKESLTWWP